MTSGPVPDWMAAVVRAWMSLPLIISMLSLMPRSLAQAGMIWLRRRASDDGTKSFQRSQWTVAPCAYAAALPEASIAAIPHVLAASAAAPESFNSLRRPTRAMADPPGIELTSSWPDPQG